MICNESTILCEDKYAFTFRNIGRIMNNISKNAKDTGNFESGHNNLLKMVKSCKDINELKYLKNDLSMAKSYLNKLADDVKNVDNLNYKMSESKRANIKKKIKKGMTVKKIESHLKWLDEVYKPAIKEREKELILKKN